MDKYDTIDELGNKCKLLHRQLYEVGVSTFKGDNEKYNVYLVMNAAVIWTIVYYMLHDQYEYHHTLDIEEAEYLLDEVEKYLSKIRKERFS